jgi:hypothetical protein
VHGPLAEGRELRHLARLLVSKARAKNGERAVRFPQKLPQAEWAAWAAGRVAACAAANPATAQRFGFLVAPERPWADGQVTAWADGEALPLEALVCPARGGESKG